MFTVREAEKLSGHSFRGIDKARGKNSIPFPEHRRANERQQFSPLQVYLFLLQRQIAATWGISIGEAAWVVRFVAESIAENWDLAIADGIIIRERRGDLFHAWLGSKAALAEHLLTTSSANDDYVWSPEAEDLMRVMQDQGATEQQIIRALLKIDKVRIDEWGEKHPQSLWFFELRPVFELMFKSAEKLNMQLPLLRDKAAWLGAE